MGKDDLLAIKGMKKEELDGFLQLAAKLKKGKKVSEDLKGKTLAMLFEKPSTRTRVSFEVAMTQLGGHAINLDFKSTQLSRGETMADSARVLSRYVDAVMLRLYKHSDLKEFAASSNVPVINGLTDLEHPCQALADYLTIRENGKEKGKFVFLGDCSNNVANSIMLVCAMFGMKTVLSCPPSYPVNEDYLKEARSFGAEVEVVSNPQEAVKDADVLYSDVWVSMGMEDEEERLKAFKPYQINSLLLSKAKSECIVLHCLPAHRGQEITSEVLDGKNSAVWDQAENRLHVQKAILLKLIA